MIHESLPLLSRAANSIYWMARYIERAGNIARYIAVNLNLQLDMAIDPSDQWQPLIATTGDAEEFARRYGEATQANVVRFLGHDLDYPSSIASCLRAARENARSIRETISSEMWNQINRMYLRVQDLPPALEGEELLEACQSVQLGCHLFDGITGATMSHNEAWHFQRLGRVLERADKTSRILDVKYFMLLPSVDDVGSPFDDIHWSAVLKSVSGFQMYRHKYGLITPRDVAEFLIFDREFPRSIHYCVLAASDSLYAITGTAEGSYRNRSEQRMGRLKAELGFTSIDALIEEGLHESIDGLQLRMNEVDEALNADFFSGRASAGAA